MIIIIFYLEGRGDKGDWERTRDGEETGIYTCHAISVPNTSGCILCKNYGGGGWPLGNRCKMKI